MADPRLAKPAADPLDGLADLTRQQAAVEFVLRSGSRFGFPYAVHTAITLDPAVGITAWFGGVKVTITGSSLSDVYLSLLHRRALRVEETPGRSEFRKADEPAIESIAVEGLQ